MSTPVITGVDGIAAAGMQPVYIIQESALPDITPSSTSVSLAIVQGGVKADCYYDFGGLDLTREAKTKERQRSCEKAVKSVKIGEVISGSLTVVWDQQATPEAVINQVYSALPEGENVYLFIANGWDSSKPLEATTKGDLWRVEVTQMDHLIATSPDEDLMAKATLNGDLFIPNMTLAA
ncbi:hypothetical protein [Brachybacterium nesterenkovii]|uniref:phage tail tube protein n=1 Tax=Brachybacterium nesterenkovii TaxID=47847 RepID=UPI00321B6468